jgi:hypothetical protein
VVLGQGLLRLSSTTFPSGTLTSFVSSAGGTIEYNNVRGVGTNLPNQLTYNNLILSNLSVTNHTLIFTTPSTPTNDSINVDFTSTRSAAKTMNVVSANSANIVNLNITGGLGISSGSTLTWSANNVIHNFTIGEDFINNGTVDLCNNAQYVAATRGAAHLIFTGSVNSGLSCSSTYGDCVANNYKEVSVSKTIDNLLMTTNENAVVLNYQFEE